MVKRGKRYKEIADKVDQSRIYTPDEAIELTKEIASARFDETVEVHLRTASDTRHADQLVRGVVVLPHGIGKMVRVLVFAEGEGVEVARQAGADHVGADDLIRQIEEGWLEFDVAIANPSMMGRIGRLGKVLGRRGLMPNPKTGTVVAAEDFGRVVEEAKKGRVEYRTDRTGIIHVSIGKASFPTEHLLENLTTLVDAVIRARPTTIKGRFIQSAFLTSTMGPSVSMDINLLTGLKVVA